MEVGEDALDPLRVVQPPLDPVSTCHQRYMPCRTGTNSGRPQMTSKTPLTGCQLKPPDSCTPMKLTVLGPHVLSLGHTDDQLEFRLPWQSPRSIGLCGSSWYPWWCGSCEWTCADGPPGFFPSPVCRASTVSRDIAFSPVPSDSRSHLGMILRCTGRSGKPWPVTWCAGRLPDRTPNDVAQKPQTCDVILSSRVIVRPWRGASCRC